MATKSRRFNPQNYAFIYLKIESLLGVDVIRPSNSPCLAQVLIVLANNSGTKKERRCVDCSRTIDLYARLNAYILPRIEDVVNQLVGSAGIVPRVPINNIGIENVHLAGQASFINRAVT